MLDNVILGMLYDCNLSGYDIKKHIENGIGVFYKASFGSIYPALKKLAEKGYIIMADDTQAARQKKIYQITDIGKEIFLEWLIQPINLNDNTNQHLAKVYFFDYLDYASIRQQLIEYEMNNTNYLRKLQTLEKKLDNSNNNIKHYFKLSTLYYGICVIEETIRWCKHIQNKEPLAELKKGGDSIE